MLEAVSAKAVESQRIDGHVHDRRLAARQRGLNGFPDLGGPKSQPMPKGRRAAG
jgi:hypothetical protein